MLTILAANMITVVIKVHEKLTEEGVTRVVPVGFSNNGAVAYQHLAHNVSSGKVRLVM